MFRKRYMDYWRERFGFYLIVGGLVLGVIIFLNNCSRNTITLHAVVFNYSPQIPVMVRACPLVDDMAGIALFPDDGEMQFYGKTTVTHELPKNILVRWELMTVRESFFIVTRERFRRDARWTVTVALEQTSGGIKTMIAPGSIKIINYSAYRLDSLSLQLNSLDGKKNKFGSVKKFFKPALTAGDSCIYRLSDMADFAVTHREAYFSTS